VRGIKGLVRIEGNASEVIRLREALKKVQEMAASASLQHAMPGGDKVLATKLIADVALQAEDALKTAGKEPPPPEPIIDEEVTAQRQIQLPVRNLSEEFETLLYSPRVIADVTQRFAAIESMMDTDYEFRRKLLRPGGKYRLTIRPVLDEQCKITARTGLDRFDRL
jgi:hypothetical protein